MKTDMFKSPEVMGISIVRKPDRKLILALDLGTTTGACHAWYKRGDPIDPKCLDFHPGQWDLSVGSYESGAARFVRLRQFLTVLAPDMIFFEDVHYTPVVSGLNKFTVGAIMARVSTSAEWFGALKGTLCAWAEETNTPCIGLPIGAIKKRATGRGNANKEDLVLACNALLGTDFDPATLSTTGVDNVADSVFLCLLGLEQYANGL